MAEWAQDWKNQNWQQMVTVSQKTWVSDQSDPAGALESQFGFKTLKGFKITGTSPVSSVMTDVTFLVYYEATTNQIDEKQITARVIKESAAETPSTQGTWGVNPISALREEGVN